MTLPPPPSVRGLQGRVQELEQALGREMRVGAALRDVGTAQATPLNLDQQLQLIVRKMSEALDSERATLYFLDEEGDTITSRVLQGSELRSIRLRVGEGIAGWVAKTGRPMLVEDAYAEPRFDPSWDEKSGYKTRSIVTAPLLDHHGRTIGVVQALNKRKGAFRREDLALLEVLAGQAAVTIDHSHMIIELREKNHELQLIRAELELRVRDLDILVRLETAMARAASFEELALSVLGEAMRTIEAQAGAVALRDAETGAVSVYVVDDKHGNLRRFPLKEGQGLIGHAMRTGESIMSDAADTDARADLTLNELAGFDCRSALAVPLEGEDRAWMGAIALYNKRSPTRAKDELAPGDRRRSMPPPILLPQRFSEDDLALVSLISANASTAIRLQVAREVRERDERLGTIGRLLSGVMHDLKTPLSVIRGYVQLMTKEGRETKREEHSVHVFKQFDHISAMQRDVLEFARGERSLFMRKVYLVTFFEEIRAALEPLMERNGVELILDMQEKGVARFDEAQMTRAVNNLARNAVEAMGDRGGKFTIKVSRDRDHSLVFAFTDTGPGIPKEIEHRLFRSFVTSGKQGGTGLGLAIVRRIAEEHGGSVDVHSTSRGATFRIRLPREEAG